MKFTLSWLKDHLETQSEAGGFYDWQGDKGGKAPGCG